MGDRVNGKSWGTHICARDGRYKKATWKYPSASGSKYSSEHSTAERKKEMIGCECTTDIVESCLGGCTYQVQRYGRIGLKAAASTSDVSRNGYLRRIAKGKKKKKKKKKGAKKGVCFINSMSDFVAVFY